MFGGVGTASDPYIISNANQLAAMAYLINNNIEAVGTIAYDEGYYVLMSNINLSERFWQPIAIHEDHPFRGRFMFKGHNVYELLLDKDYEVTHYGGLFGYISPDAIINTDPGDYTFAIAFITSGTLLIIIIVIIIIILIYKRQKKAKQLENASTIDINSINKDDEDDDETKKNE